MRCWLWNSTSSSALCLSRNAAALNARPLSSTVTGPYGSYAEEYAFSLKQPEQFWLKAAENLHWFKPPQTAFEQDPVNPHLHRWFPDGVMNTCYNCLDIHCIGNEGTRADQVALFYDSPVTGVKQQFTYQQLLDQVSTFAGALQNDLGVVAGDRIVIYMPMVPQVSKIRE